MSNPFFKNYGPLKISEIIKSLNINVAEAYKDKEIYDIKDLASSEQNDITFFHSKKYKDVAKRTKARAIQPLPAVIPSCHIGA